MKGKTQFEIWNRVLTPFTQFNSALYFSFFQPELKALVRAGIPHEHRATIWKHCINGCVEQTRKIAGERYYQQLLESIKGKPSPAVKQIELDLLRTLPNNKHYERLDADGASY